MDQLHVVGSEDPGQVAGSTPNAAAVQSAIQAAGELDPGLQEFYAQKFGHSIQDDIAAAATHRACLGCSIHTRGVRELNYTARAKHTRFTY